MMQVFEGSQVRVFQALVLKRSLEMYDRHHIKPNSAYTPKNMLLTASKFTGKKYGRQQYLQAAADLQAWVDKHVHNPA